MAVQQLEKPARARMREWVREQRRNGTSGVADLKALAWERFHNDRRMLEGGLGSLVEWAAYDLAEQERTAAHRGYYSSEVGIQETTDAALLFLSEHVEVFEGRILSIGSLTRPQLAAVIDDRQDDIDGRIRHITLLRGIYDLTADAGERTLLANYFKRNPEAKASLADLLELEE